MFRKLVAAAFVLVLLTVAYLALAPVPIHPVAWQSPTDAGYVGAYARNTRLAGLHEIPLGGETGPEHVVVGPDGKLYASVDGGKILRMNGDGSSLEVWAQTGGRVFGFDFDRQGGLIAADAMRGLLSIRSDGAKGRKITVLADKVRTSGGDDPIRYANAVVVASDGKIYFTDSSRRFAPGQFGGTFEACLLDLFEHSATGRLLVYDPATTTTEIVAGGLTFANGVALSGDEGSIFVSETGEYRIWRLAIGARNLNLRDGAATAGGERGAAQIVLANLPGHPDNLMRGRDGRIWVGLVAPRSRPLDTMAGSPLMRKVAWRLKPIFPLPPVYGHVFAFDEAGQVVADLQDPTGTYPDTSGVTETADRLYIQSLHAAVLGWLARGADRP